MSPGQRLAWRRKMLGITQARMAAAVGMSLDRLQRLEWDRGKLAPAELLPLLAGYRLAPGVWLAGRREQGAPLDPQLAARIGLLSEGEQQALADFVQRLTEGRTRAGA